MDMKLWICKGGAQAGAEEKHAYVQSLEYEIKNVRRQVSEVTLRLGAPTEARVKVLLHKMDVTGEHMTGLEPHAALVQFADQSPPYPWSVAQVERMKGIYTCHQFTCGGLWI